MLPRRVPWKSLTELDEVCSWIYSPEADDKSKRAAVNRIAAWRCAHRIPHALESTWMILSVTLSDPVFSEHSGGTFSPVALRQAYALAIIRLVNGLVDPLQQGVYARPISSIAAQIGLPSWLVELRHAATHEDLPSMHLLREAANQSLTWLLDNYWLPTLSPGNLADKSPPEIPPLAPLLKDYKALLKLTTRDAFLKSRHKGDILKLLRDVERWIGEIKVSYGLSMGQMDDEDKERWAISRLCDEIFGKGFLVPVSKKKRSDPNSISLSVPPNAGLWEQLLDHVQTNHPTFGSHLVSHIAAHVVASDGSDPSEDECMSGWLMWAVQNWGAKDCECRSEDVAFVLMAQLSRTDFGDSSHGRMQRILSALSFSDDSVKDQCLTLLAATSVSRDASISSRELSLEIMEERLVELTRKLSKAAVATSDLAKSFDAPTDAKKNPAPGIRLLGAEEGWRPCPIGFNGITMRA